MSAKANTVTKVRLIVEPYASELGLDIWDIRYVKEGTDWYLRIYIDKEGGVSIDDCVNLSQAITKPLDDADPISQSYLLEVSSPGVERELVKDEHFKKYINADITMRLIRPIDNVRDFSGVLTAYDNAEITVTLPDGSTLTVNKKDTSYVKLDDFNIDALKG